MGERQKEKHKN